MVYVFPPNIIHVQFPIIIIDVGELILSGKTIEVTVYETAQLIYLLSI